VAALFLTGIVVNAVAQTLPRAKSGTVVTSVVPLQKSAPQYGNEGAIVGDVEVHYRYNEDGTGTYMKHVLVKVQDEAGARAFSVLPIEYASKTESAQMVSVTVTHPDGSKVVTPASDDMTLPARVTQQAPLYSDLEVLQVPVRGLRPGDTLDYTMQINMNKAQDPGEFWGSEDFLKGLVILKGVVSLDVPADKPVQVWDPGLKPVVTNADGRKVYTWNYSQTKPTQDLKKKNNATSTKMKPSVAWTTFPSWQALGAWYESLAGPRAAVTPAITAEANAITAHAKTPEEQARAIYDFVSTHIRYIGIDFGIGRYEPHSAETVLADQYGDCKDKDTLLEALLRAKGFTTAPALVGVGVKMIPELPSPELFNHVITTVTIGGKQVWLDSTPEVTPFEFLVSGVRDKQALVIPKAGPAKLERTPAEPPFAEVDRMESTATLADDGDLKAHMVIVDRSDKEILLRDVARNVAPAQWDQAVQYLSRLMGFGGTVSHSEFEHGENLNVPIRLTYDYEHPKFGDWGDLRILPLFPIVYMPAAPDKEPKKAVQLGSERTEIAKTVIHLPVRFTPDLPDGVHVKTAFATYDETYSFANGALTVDRKVVVLASKVPAKNWKAYKKFVSDTSLFDLTYIQLLANGTGSGSSSKGLNAASSGESAQQLVAQADDLERANNLERARKLLDKAKALSPQQPFLWSNYGWIAMVKNQLPEAIQDYEKELHYHPEETYVSGLYASVLVRSGQTDKAIAVLKALISAHPKDSSAAQMLATLEESSDLPDAIAVLQSALAVSPGNGGIAAELATFLIRNHESDKAAVLLEKELGSATDAMTLNNASYELALTGQDLTLAEQKSFEAVMDLEAKTAQVQVSGANEESFTRARELTEYWDTLGYILMKEGKLKEARSYLEASWNNAQSPLVGLHYGRVLEQLKERAEALRIYKLALHQENDAANEMADYERSTGQKLPAPPQETHDKLTAAIARLKREHVASTGEDPTFALQSMRTFHLLVVRAPKKFQQATFRLEFAADGPPQVMQVNGDAWMAQFVRKIKLVRFPELVPAGSKAELVRDAAMSCSPGDRHCVLVLMPMGPMQSENISVQ
jgi:tetratricopeptide (TPR) repeat protein